MVQLEPPPRLSNVYRMCDNFIVQLFTYHFYTYYDQVYYNSIHSSTIYDESGETDQV